jgi:hypothetical protein
MLQVHTCVSVHCAQCGDSLGGPGLAAHYSTEEAALDAATVAGWQVGPGERWWCSACGPVLTCEEQGHEFTRWHQLRPERGWALREYRYCLRCCLHESRPPESGQRVGAGVDVVGEVA